MRNTSRMAETLLERISPWRWAAIPFVALGIIAVPVNSAAAFQIARDMILPRSGPFVQEAENNSEADEEEGPLIEINREVLELAPNEMRLMMSDGTVITGRMDRETIQVTTDFGTLNVPVERIKKLTPGISSNPQLSETLATLLDQLGADNFEVREGAQKALAAYGVQLSNVLEQANDEGNVERQKRLGELREGCRQLVEEAMEFEAGDRPTPWIYEDQVETDQFTIVGRVELDQFELASRYGTLQVNFADVLRGDRTYGQKETVRRSLVVMGTDIAVRKYKSSRIRVEAGDRITISAEGQVVMSPWGSNASTGPDGNPSYGMYNNFPGGSLLAKVGSGGEEVLIGSQKSFVAKRGGVLNFGVAVQADYAQANYAFPGQYRVRILVEPN